MLSLLLPNNIYPGNPVTGSYILQIADDFTCTDPVTFIIIYIYLIVSGIHLQSGITFAYLQVTDSADATVRVYIEQFEPDVMKHDVDAQTALKPLVGLIISIFWSLSLLLQIVYCLLVILFRFGTLCIEVEGPGREKPTVT